MDTTPPKFHASEFIYAANQVMRSGCHNFQGCRIPIFTRINVDVLAIELHGYHDDQICELMRFGWPINALAQVTSSRPYKNHKGATEYPGEIKRYIEKELSHGAVLGPLQGNPFVKPIHISPLNT